MKNFRFDSEAWSAIEQAASDWVTKVDRGLSREEQEEFDRWLAKSKAHEKAYSEQKWNWEELDRLAGLQTAYGSSEDPDLLLENRSGSARRSWFGSRFAMVACAALVLGAVFTWTGLQVFNGNAEQNRNENVIVERIQTRNLEDGSSLQLNRGAEIEVAYSDMRRTVRLLKGEVNFMVEKDPDRPFFVEVAGVHLRAVGTEFNVRFQPHEVEVIVTEGTVAVQSSSIENLGSQSPASEAFIEVNQRVKVDLNSDELVPLIESISEETVARELIWQPVLIDFENVPLSEIVDEFNRRNPVQMVIVDASVNEARLSSMFWSDNVNGLIRLLESNFEIKAEWGEDGTIYLFNNS